jgi:hypothetical protein
VLPMAALRRAEQHRHILCRGLTSSTAKSAVSIVAG